MERNLITIEALETLDAIDRRGSFAKAAEELSKATSAISYTVQKLEEQLAITLFQRQGRRSVLTPAGRLIVEEGREILQATIRLTKKAKEVATGWETRINIAVESLQSYPLFFRVLDDFLTSYSTIDIDVCESVLNGGWEALDRGQVDLIVGSPGPVPQQKGFRAVRLAHSDLVPVVAAQHLLADIATETEKLETLLPQARRVITHDTSTFDVSRSAGLASDGNILYVQNIDQKIEAIMAGIGVGHLPRQRIEKQLNNGELVPLALKDKPIHDSFLAWKISNKGKGLQALTQRLSAVFG